MAIFGTDILQYCLVSECDSKSATDLCHLFRDSDSLRAAATKVKWVHHLVVTTSITCQPLFSWAVCQFMCRHFIMQWCMAVHHLLSVPFLYQNDFCSLACYYILPLLCRAENRMSCVVVLQKMLTPVHFSPTHLTPSCEHAVIHTIFWDDQLVADFIKFALTANLPY